MASFDTNALSHPYTPQPANPFEIAAQALGVKNALLDNKIRQSEYDAQMARGAAYAHHYNALTGEYDIPAVQSELGSTSAGQFGLPEAVTTLRSQQKQAIDNQDAQLSFQRHASTAATDGMGRVIADPTDANVKGYATFMSRLTPAATPQINAIAAQVVALPTKAQRVEALKGAFTAHMGQEAASRVFGTPTSVDDGQNIQTGTQASEMDGGAFTPAGVVQKQVGPESNASLVPVTMRDPTTGQMITVYRPASELRQAAGDGTFTGRRIDTAGGGAEPMAGSPSGYDEQYKTGQAVQNTLAAQQSDVTQNIATLRNLDALLAAVPKDARSRTLKEITNNVSKFGIGGKDAAGYATLAQEIDKAGTTLRKQMMDGGGGPHTNAGLADLEHITPGMEMTPTAARALTNEMLTAALYQQGRQKVAAGQKDATKVLSALADYDQNFDPRFATIQRLGPEEGREYAKSHIEDPAQYASSVYRMARAARDKGYDYGLTPQQRDRIIAAYEAQSGR
ncbi:hypothetical protein AA103196_3098 [Ameyamaea chiangmaiensis NBRC 103196]|uniref:Uncharacterized protein n=1 Tax=Ameyamaea chiangmaiensis TaxID=442969 RepID=A0A850P9W7_9PROT|nr:hypothetical protein [Ameyamaea chiangmaiensis]MBS4074584.1 hypothetical protein [Ameyamaea chiangmaiensis]NVN39340.1 hypothetical protein [Ameyamaea chiangmaiensis]GBQ72568.1 hypothetical protein AA103196_3098 [Ameyamaea chiangmaiensis NBRC 103196]